MIGNTFQFPFEISLIEWCQNNIPWAIVKTLDILSYSGDVVFVVAIIGVFYLCIDKKLGRKIMINTLLSLLFAGILKNIFRRRRPYFDNENVNCLKIVDPNYDLYDVAKQGFSFPSMHSANITAILATIYSYYKKHSLLFISILIPFVVGISRFILGCHYPTDVLVGWLLGLSSVIIMNKIGDSLSDNQIYIIFIVIIVIGFSFCKSADFYSAAGVALGFIGADIVDKKYINFKNTKNIFRMICRLALTAVIFLAISEGLKLLGPDEDTFISFVFRTFRYALASFVALGLSPALYKYNILKINDYK